MCLQTVQERYQLIARALRAERDRNGGEPPDGIEPQQNVFILELVNQDRNWIERLLERLRATDEESIRSLRARRLEGPVHGIAGPGEMMACDRKQDERGE